MSYILIKNKKGQTSTEYVVLLAVSIIIFTILISVAYEQFSDIGKVKSRDTSVNSLKQIADAAKEVYLQGSGASKMVVVTFPSEVGDNSINIMNNSLHLSHAGSDITVPMDFPVYGSLATGPGTYEITLVSEGNQVRIGVSGFSVLPSYLTFSFCQSNVSQSGSQNLTFTNMEDSPIDVSLIMDWSYIDVTISTNNSVHLNPNESKVINVSAQISTSATGAYSGSIITTSANSTFSIPVSVTMLDCTCVGGAANITLKCTNVSYIKIKTYSNSTYGKEKVAFGLQPPVSVTTGNWSANSNITIDIKDPSNASVPGYPKTVQTNSTGGYFEQWQISGGYGIYTIYMNNSIVMVNTVFNAVGCS